MISLRTVPTPGTVPAGESNHSKLKEAPVTRRLKAAGRSKGSRVCCYREHLTTCDLSDFEQWKSLWIKPFSCSSSSRIQNVQNMSSKDLLPWKTWRKSFTSERYKAPAPETHSKWVPVLRHRFGCHAFLLVLVRCFWTRAGAVWPAGWKGCCCISVHTVCVCVQENRGRTIPVMLLPPGSESADNHNSYRALKSDLDRNFLQDLLKRPGVKKNIRIRFAKCDERRV